MENFCSGKFKQGLEFMNDGSGERGVTKMKSV